MSDLTREEAARIAARAVGEEYVEDPIVGAARRAAAEEDKEPDLHQRRPGESDRAYSLRIREATDAAWAADRKEREDAAEARRVARQEDAELEAEAAGIADRIMGLEG